MNETQRPAIEVTTSPVPTHAVIWLHGLGADGSDFVPVVPELGLAPTPGVRFVFPHAPEQPVTCNGGLVMPAWYDILSLAPGQRAVDEDGVLRSRETVRQLIARENARGIPCSRIFLAGFSQGGAVAYATALTHPAPLAGLIALSTYLPVTERVARERTAANAQLPAFIAHGLDDEVVGLGLGLAARDFLRDQGYTPEWHTYPMTHSVCLEEIVDLGVWLKARLAAPAGA